MVKQPTVRCNLYYLLKNSHEDTDIKEPYNLASHRSLPRTAAEDKN